MASRRPRNLRIGPLVHDVREALPFHILTLVLSLGGAVGIPQALGGEPRVREGLIAFALIFLVLEWFVLYNDLGRIGEQMDELAGVSGLCSLIAGPRHAKLLGNGAAWRSDGVVWLGLSCDLGSQLRVTLKAPSGVRVGWVAREHVPYLWRRDGVSDEGMETWSLDIPRTEAKVTHLGQFYLAAHQLNAAARSSVTVAAMGKSADGMAISHEIDIGLLAHLPQDNGFQPLPAQPPSSGIGGPTS